VQVCNNCAFKSSTGGVALAGESQVGQVRESSAPRCFVGCSSWLLSTCSEHSLV